MTPATLPILLSLAMIPFSFILAKVNYKAILKEKVDDLWHRVQFYSLYLAGLLSMYFLFDTWSERIFMLLTLSSSYWILFEVFLNLLRGLDPMYIGETSKIDRTVRKWFTRRVRAINGDITEVYNAADAKTAFLAFKIFLWFGSVSMFAYFSTL